MPEVADAFGLGRLSYSQGPRPDEGQLGSGPKPPDSVAEIIKAMPLPAGQVTFVLTDIEGSTSLFRSLGDRWPPLLDAHLSVLRHAMADHGGQEVKTLGDGALFAFSDTGAALHACADAQAALRRHPWPADAALRVRMGVHTGEALPADGDYVAFVLHQLARVAGVAHGDQVVVSAASAAAAGRLPQPLRLLDLGEHDLRDFDRSTGLYQLARPDLPEDFPPLRAAPSRRHNLPLRPTSFVGRDEDVVELRALLQAERLVNVCGAGGVGKTRLALEVAESRYDDHPDGVNLVELAPLHDTPGVIGAISAVLGLQGFTDSTPQALARAIGNRRVLLLLDNCEHLAEAAADVVTAVLQHCPEASVLATSRVPLGVPGEAMYQLRPLSITAARALFEERARSSRSSLPESRDEDLLTAVCERLDGLPLAIELVAARLRSMPLAALASGLDGGINILAVGGGGRDHRQRALAATVAWSYELLTPGERSALRRLALFAGAFTAEAAADVADAEAAVWSLVDQSLLYVADQAPDLRFAMLQPVREFALERLRQKGEASEARPRLLAWAVRTAEAAAEGMFGSARRSWLRRFADDIANLRAPLLDSSPGNAVDRLRLVTAVSAYELVTLNLAQVPNDIERALEDAADAPPLIRARAQHQLARIFGLTGDLQRCVVLLRDSIAGYESAGEIGLRAEALAELAYRHSADGDSAAAQALLAEADELTALSPPASVCHVRLHQAHAALSAGEIDLAIALLEENTAMAQAQGLQDAQLGGFTNLAEMLLLRDEAGRARALAAKAMELCDPHVDRWARRHLAWILGRASYVQGDLAQAHRHFSQLVQPPLAEVPPFMVGGALEHLAIVWAGAGEPQDAARALGAAERFWRRSGAPRRWDQEGLRRKALAAIEDRIDQQAPALLAAGAGLEDGEISALVGSVGTRLMSSA